MIQKRHNEIEGQLLNIITGRSPLPGLSDLGIEIAKEKGSFRLRSNLPALDVRPTVDDILRGFRLYQEHPNRLRLWAFLLLAETAIDLSELEATQTGGRLLDALWNASRSGTISIGLLNEITNELLE